MSLKYAYSAIMAAAFSLAASVAWSQSPAQNYDTGMIPAPHILLPSGDVDAAVVLISDKTGWSEKEDALAKGLVAKGALVIGIDLPSYLQSLAKDQDDCIYMVSDIEALSQQVQRAAKNNDYRLPIVAGIGGGGALALAIAAQTPAATIGQTVAVDPDAGIALTRELCTPANKMTVGNRMIYGLTDGPLPNPVSATFTKAASEDGRAHVASLAAKHSDIEVSDDDGDAQAVLADTLETLIAAAGDAENPLGLPLTVLDTKPTRDAMAIIYSGDGGWRDIDKDVGDLLQKQGMPVVGVDSLRYFWSERQPQETADDLSRIIDLYRKRWKVKHVVLIGYSFGADILPKSYNLLPKEDQARIRQLSLLAFSHDADYKISVLGWLGASGDGKGGDPVDDLKTIDPAIVQCVYGTEDAEDDACPGLKGNGTEVIEIEGGHHFDEDYPALARRILDSFDRRMKARP
jgi:type IV secretory pathway VirJ component